ncbi:MAG TPA: hypothetical protein DCZ94_00485 [Lentisphaeria bacterium]|nr:MAG: hypothetical protein A2X48_12045 [Lentisphaerae bacterium GWF2_49_21]HBC85408.1 hypothetical protein [Lentisphaeria bacterium]
MKKLFNLVEVTLAIAVVGIGIAGVMSLFPVGFQASRDAIGDNYASCAAEQFISFFSRKCNDPTDLGSGKDFWETYISWDNGTASNFADDVAGSILTTIPTAADETAITFSTTAVEGNIYPDSNASPNPQLYRIKAGSSLVIDFHATVRIWRSQLNGLWIFEDNMDIPHAIATRINIEISWPVEKPYASREKRYYTAELFRQAE